MQLKPSLLLSTAAAVLMISMPQAANAQSEFLTCVFGAIGSGTISADLSDMAALTATLKPLCCTEGSDDPTCTALNCVDTEVSNFIQIILCPHLILSDTIFHCIFIVDTQTQTMVEPCTCGEAMGASAAMAADTQLALLIPPDLFSSTNGKLKCFLIVDKRSTFLLRYMYYLCSSCSHEHQYFLYFTCFCSHF